MTEGTVVTRHARAVLGALILAPTIAALLFACIYTCTVTTTLASLTF